MMTRNLITRLALGAALILAWGGAQAQNVAQLQQAAPATVKLLTQPKSAPSGGQWVMTYKSAQAGNLTDGAALTISAGSADTLLLSDFWAQGTTVKATVNGSAISIPGQQLGSTAQYGTVYLSATEGTVASDSLVRLTTPWRIYNADSTILAADSTVLERANGSMTATFHGTEGSYTWPVVLRQVSQNVVTVKNMGGHGCTAEVVLGSDGTVSVAQQRLWAGGSSRGNFYCRAVDWSTGEVTYPIRGTFTPSQVSWGGWMMLSTKQTYFGFDNATLSGITFSAPQASASWQGSGTEQDPYRIKTVADLLLLANRVNADTALIYGTVPNVYSKTYRGTWFSLESDLDLSGLRFEPIGRDFGHRFDGILLGNGHSICNLNIDTKEAGYAGLIGSADREAVARNLQLVNPVVTTTGNYAGCFGMFYGLLDSISVTGASISNTGGITAGGIVALGQDVNRCAFKGSIDGSGALIAGGVAGALYGTISQSHATGDIAAAKQAAGGVVGYVYGLQAKVQSSYYNGTLASTQHSNANLGGVAGQVYGGEIAQSFSVANVIGIDREACTGGVVGQLSGGMANCYATGYVSNPSSKSTGGLVGQARTFVVGSDTVQSYLGSSYYAGRLNANIYQYDPATECREIIGTQAEGANPTIQYCYFDRQLTTIGTQSRGLTTSQLTAAAGLEGFSSRQWNFSAGYYPRLHSIANSDVVDLSASVVALNDEMPDNVGYVSESARVSTLGNVEASTTGHCGTITGGLYVLNMQSGIDTLSLQAPGLTPRTLVLTVSPKYFEGKGTEADPFQIKTKTDVLRLGQLTSDLNETFTGIWFRQMNDIDMENDSTFVGLSAHEASNSFCKFAGIYDGGGHALHNLWINSIDWKVEPTDSTLGTPATSGSRSQIYKGFIGTLDKGGVLKNLTLASDCHADVWAYAGALVGNNYGTVDSCISYATVRGYSGYIGGLVGRNNASGIISHCLNAGHITGGAGTVGGIAAMSNGTMSNCMNVGTVESKVISTFNTRIASQRTVGGIVATASGSVMTQVANAGHIIAPGGNAAGIAASFSSGSKAGANFAGNNDADQVLSYGTVFTPNAATTGAISANGLPPYGTLTHIVYDHQATALEAVAGDRAQGITPMATDSLTGGQELSGFPAGTWTYAAGRYPVLSQFANLPIVVEASKVWVRPAVGESTNHLKTNATLGTATWRLQSGTAFSISGGTLQVPAAAAQDTLVATTASGFATAYALRVPAPVPLQGLGTESSPYELRNAAEWLALAHYIADNQNQLSGTYIKVMSDFSFADTTFLPMGYDGITPFGATLLGGGHKISYISYTATAAYQGAFVTLSATSTVRDLTLQGAITSSYGHTGGFAGRLAGALIGCTNAISVTGKSTYTAGFAARAEASARFERCTNSAYVTGANKWVAGFVADAPSVLTFTDCVNAGTIINTSTQKHTAGFVTDGRPCNYIRCTNSGNIVAPQGANVAGFQSYATGEGTICFIDCRNVGAIEAANTTAGLLGGISASTTLGRPMIRATRSANEGAVTSHTSATTGTAGLFAGITPGTVITDCSNSGTILSEKSNNVGGIWGQNINGTEKDSVITVRRVSNTAAVSGVMFVGGIGGNIPAYATLDSCSNTGAVTGSQGIGGLGNVQGRRVAISHCWNAGAITATKCVAGGLTGYGNGGFTVRECFNVGSVTCDGGFSVGGLCAQGYAVISDSYNHGNVTGTDRVGGIIGQTNHSTNAGYTATQVLNCINAARVTGDTQTGNIIGTYGTTYWSLTSGNAANGNLAVTDWADQSSDAAICTRLSVRQLTAKNNLNAAIWNVGDQYTLPTLRSLDNAAARAYAAAVVLTDGDTYEVVTTNVKLGVPDSVTWTSSAPSLVKIEGENGWTTTPSTAQVTLTATCGDFSRGWLLKLNVTSGIDDNLANVPVLRRSWFTLSGQQASPAPHDGQVYIVVTTYQNGAVRATKVSNR